MDISKTTWNLAPLFSGDNDPEMEKNLSRIEESTSKFISKWKDRDDYLIDPIILKEALEEYQEWMNSCSYGERNFYYWWMKSRQDENSTEYKAKYNQIDEFAKKITTDIQFFPLKIAKIKDQQKMLEFEGLNEFKHFLETIFIESKYLLSEPEEKIMLMKSSVSYENWEKLTVSFLSKSEHEVLTEENIREVKTFADIISLCESSKKEVRDVASAAANEILNNLSDIAEAEINSILANKKIDDTLRGYDRADKSRHVSDDMDSDVVDKAVSTITNRFDIAKRYYNLKASLFKQEKITYFERNVAFEEVEGDFSYQESVDLVYKVFQNLDDEFAQIFKSFVEEGHIDVFPRKGKDNGAWCQYISPSMPTYLMLNHADKLRDVLTIAHEAGHGINGEFMKKKQRALNYNTPTSTAEVASTFMEDFVLKEILKTVTEEEKLNILLQKLNDEVSTIFRQIAFYNFETDLHKSFREKGYLSKQEIGELFIKNIKAYLGDSVSFPEGAENWWIYVGHFRYFFYVYSYATGLLISKSMQNNVKKDHAFIEKVKEFLIAGSSKSPKNIFSDMGIDITDEKFWNAGLDEIDNLLNEVEALAKKLGKI
ncbi:MAG: M3 family oligoendopeptidase [bacterium]